MSAAWKQRREGGGPLAVRALYTVTRLGGRRLARSLLWPVAAYFMLRRRAERRDSLAYLARALGRPAGWRDVLRHIHTFSCTVLDRVFLLSEDTRGFDVTATGLDGLHAQLAPGRGVLLFGSHLGSFEVLRVLARQRPEFQVRVVLDKGHSPAVTQLLEALDPAMAANIIDAGQDGPTIVLEIQRATQAGAMVALLVDRVQPGEPSVSVPFLGAPAAFPVAPWLIAAVLKVPVTLAFGLYRGGARYDLVFESFSDGLSIPRRERATAVPALIGCYATRLEHFVRNAPFNWFNFYDFWEQGSRPSNLDGAVAHDGPPATPGGAAGAGAGDALGIGRATGA